MRETLTTLHGISVSHLSIILLLVQTICLNCQTFKLQLALPCSWKSNYWLTLEVQQKKKKRKNYYSSIQAQRLGATSLWWGPRLGSEARWKYTPQTTVLSHFQSSNSCSAVWDLARVARSLTENYKRTNSQNVINTSELMFQMFFQLSVSGWTNKPSEYW